MTNNHEFMLLWDTSRNLRVRENWNGVSSLSDETVLIQFPRSERRSRFGNDERCLIAESVSISLFSSVRFLIVLDTGVEMTEIWLVDAARETRDGN